MHKILGVFVFDIPGCNTVASDSHHQTHARLAVYQLTDFYFFSRAHIRELMLFSCRMIVQRITPDIFYRIQLDADHQRMFEKYELNNLIVNCLRTPSGHACCVVSRRKYTAAPILKLITECLYEDLTHTQVEHTIKRMDTQLQDDVIGDIENDIAHIKAELLISIDKLLERGEKLDDLISKAEDLSATTRTFNKNAERLNRCCIIL